MWLKRRKSWAERGGSFASAAVLSVADAAEASFSLSALSEDMVAEKERLASCVAGVCVVPGTSLLGSDRCVLAAEAASRSMCFCAVQVGNKKRRRSHRLVVYILNAARPVS